MSTSLRRALSPTLSDTTTRASEFDFDGKFITRADLRSSVQAYEQLLAANRTYRSALLNLSSATATFADAIQACANLKGAEFVTTCRNSTSAGFHHLFANHLHILADSMERQFDCPLSEQLAEYTSQMTDRSVNYERSLRESGRIIRQTEERNIRLGKSKERNMSTFKASLTILQNQVQEIERLKCEHYKEVEVHEAKFAETVQGKIAVVVRSTFEIFERLTAKSTDPVMEAILQSIPDPFDSYGSHEAEDRLFSVLQPFSLLSENSSSTSLHSLATSRGNPAWLPLGLPEARSEDVESTDPSTAAESSHGASISDIAESKPLTDVERSAENLTMVNWQDLETLPSDAMADMMLQSPSGTIKFKPKTSLTQLKMVEHDNY